MNTGQGQKIAGALKAIAQLHGDTSRLLLDCDKYIGNGRRSVFGNYATRDLTYHARAPYWMAEGVYRFYEAGPLQVEGITVTFFKPGEELEPLLKIGTLEYARTRESKAAVELREICHEWDLWWLYFESGNHRKLDTVLEYTDVDEHRIAQARLIAVPLFSIHRIEDVRLLMDRVIAPAPKTKAAAAE